MITYRYGPFQPDDDPFRDKDRLMNLLAEMIMKYDVELDEALRMLIDNGFPVNLFLKEGGMEDLVEEFRRRIEESIRELLTKYSLEGALNDSRKEQQLDQDQLETSLKKLPKSIRSSLKLPFESIDQILRTKWELFHQASDQTIHDQIEKLIRSLSRYETVEAGSRKYPFSGELPVTVEEAIELIRQLDELTDLKEALNEAVEKGDLFNLNLEDLAKYLGPESYEEFIERREAIFQRLKELMKKDGSIVEHESGKLQLSPKSIRRVGRRLLEEIFSQLKIDSTGGSHMTEESGEGENVGSTSKQYEFGDPLSHIDIPSSVVNAILRSGQSRPNFSDVEIFEGRGSSRSATAVLLDMSGSMMRSDRFYNAKRVTLALDSLIREEFRDDKFFIVGFGTLARVYSPAEIPALQPYPVTMYNSSIRLRFQLSNMDETQKRQIPQYFTNLQRGLQLARSLIGSKETKNKQIILITDGVPTAHIEQETLHVNYPPSPSDFESALREVRCCTEDGIVINTFLLTSDWEMSYFGEESFISQFAKSSMGRILYPHPANLDQFVLLDFIGNKKSYL